MPNPALTLPVPHDRDGTVEPAALSRTGDPGTDAARLR